MTDVTEAGVATVRMSEVRGAQELGSVAEESVGPLSTGAPGSEPGQTEPQPAVVLPSNPPTDIAAAEAARASEDAPAAPTTPVVEATAAIEDASGTTLAVTTATVAEASSAEMTSAHLVSAADLRAAGNRASSSARPSSGGRPHSGRPASVGEAPSTPSAKFNAVHDFSELTLTERTWRKPPGSQQARFANYALA